MSFKLFAVLVCSSLPGIRELLPEDSYVEGEVGHQEGSGGSEVSRAVGGGYSSNKGWSLQYAPYCNWGHSL